MAKHRSKSMEEAVTWVRGLMDHLAEMYRMDRRTAEKAAMLLRAGCAHSIYKGNKTWDDEIVASPGLTVGETRDTGDALLALSNRLCSISGTERYSLEDIDREFGQG